MTTTTVKTTTTNKYYDSPTYSFRMFGNFLEIAKWTDRSRPEDVVSISMAGKGKCNCLGSLRQPYCKHRKMVDFLMEKFPGTLFWGCFYDYDNQILYHPDDGEGVPLRGAVDIRSLGPHNKTEL